MTLPAWITSALAAIPVLQHLASGLASIPSLWGHGQTSGPGSGWYKFWNAVASYPGNASPTTSPSASTAVLPSTSLPH